MTEQWRLLDTGPRSAAENMALDQAILEARSKGLVPNTLRFLQFHPRCALVGYHQTVEQEIRLDYCRKHGIDINRRITGGGALFWDESQLGWEVYAPIDQPGFPRRLEDLYALLCQGAVRGLAGLGVRAAFRPRNDIEVAGRKLSGTGGTELDGAFLFQGTLLVDFDVDAMLRALRIPTEKLKNKELASARERVTCLAWELGVVPPLEAIEEALAQGFGETLGAQWVRGDLTECEQTLLAQKLPFMRSDEWVYSVKRSLSSRQELRGVHKAPGGLIRAYVAVDSGRDRIEQILVTGDFFAYPSRAILDLETRLKGAPAGEVRARIVDSFDRDRVRIPGIAPDDVALAVEDALSKRAFIELGLDAADANCLFTVVEPWARLARPTLLLLSYCAKLPDCEYRYVQGCDRCGRCSVGDAYALADKYGLQPVTIQNYEMLEQTLKQYYHTGARAFVGSCCEPFCAKHRRDFEASGLPGALVDLDSSSCYDLGEEVKAHGGQFENQTELRLGLLEWVVNQLTARCPAKA